MRKEYHNSILCKSKKLEISKTFLEAFGMLDEKSLEEVRQMEFQQVMKELETLGTERTKKLYLGNGAKEPLFGVATGAMKPMSKAIKRNQPLAEELYATGNYDAMYFAGVIADPEAMTEEDFDRWMETAYFYMLSDYVVAVTLSEAPIAQQVADRWIESGEELKRSAGWSAYCWLLGNRKDEEFDVEKIHRLLDLVKMTIHSAPPRAQSSMNNFVYTVAISFLPLHEKAIETAREIGQIEMERPGKKPAVLDATASIEKWMSRGKLGFKRRYVRC